MLNISFSNMYDKEYVSSQSEKLEPNNVFSLSE